MSDLSMLTGGVHAVDGYAVRVAPEPRVVAGPSRQGPDRTVWENTISGPDVVNGPVVVADSNTRLVHVPPGAVYEVRIVNEGTENVYLAIGQVATRDHYKFVPNQVAAFRIAGEQDLNAIAALGSYQTVRVWASSLR